jgi:Ca-activated chloride channel homolog
MRGPWTNLSLPKLNRLFRRNKFVLFGLIGAIGCFFGAVAGEALLALTKLPEPPMVTEGGERLPPQAVALVIDCSGSMSWEWLGLKGLIGLPTKLSEVKSAAKTFGGAQTGTANEIAVIGFGTAVHIGTELTRDQNRIESAIENMSDGGSTNMAEALTAAMGIFGRTSLTRNILLFTDGQPASSGGSYAQAQAATLQAAGDCRENGVRIIAIATGDADLAFLSQVTGDSSLVIPVTSGDFGRGFAAAAQKIYGRSLVESGPTSGSLARRVLRVAGWTALVALGLSLALIVGQNLHLRRRFLTLREGVPASAGALSAGLLAGAAGQMVFSPLASSSFLQSAGTLLGWGVLGALVGRGMAWFVPNLAPRRARTAGMVGGTLAAIAFLYVSATLTDILGRLLGASILGLSIGLLIAFVELGLEFCTSGASRTVLAVQKMKRVDLLGLDVLR